jgi:thiamine-monophosphate kinase
MQNGQMPHKPKQTPISDLGEFKLIEHLTHSFSPYKQPSTTKGVGDDAAVIHINEHHAIVVSTDLLVEGIHFDLIYTPLKHLGYKAVVVNLSDIYAMNAIPRQITVSIAISSRFTVEALEELYSGIAAACKTYNVDLVGGDTSSTLKGMVISITAIGDAHPNKITYRNTAQIGDAICISGDLGAAYLGLQILEREKRIYLDNPQVQPDLEEQSYLLGRQLKPEARADIIAHLNKLHIKPTAMIDVSDGLSSDLLHICTQSNVGCLITEEYIPVHTDTLDISAKFHLSPITCMLNGGEDYELLFTLNPQDAATIEQDIYGVAVIGYIVPKDEGYKVISRGGNEHNLVAQGWKHI